MKIIATDRKGLEHIVEGTDGWTIMEALRDAGLPIAAECGGACACATCHVYVDGDWFAKLKPPSPEELDMLDMAVAVEIQFQAVVPDTLRARPGGYQGDHRTRIAD